MFHVETGLYFTQTELLFLFFPILHAGLAGARGLTEGKLGV